MFSNTCSYLMRKEIIAGFTHYYVSFRDSNGSQQEIEVHRRVFLECLRIVRAERNLRRWDERHVEQSGLTDETLYNRALDPQKSVEESALDNFRNEQLRQAIHSLPKIQRRRFVLYHVYGFTYEQIAETEGCSFQAVAKAVKVAESAIKKFFENQG